MCAVNSEELSDRFLDYAASIIIFAKIRDRIIYDKSGVLRLMLSSTILINRLYMPHVGVIALRSKVANMVASSIVEP